MNLPGLDGVRLETRDGALVGTFSHAMPPFLPGLAPEVVIWGERVFTKHEEPADPSKPLVYREGLLFVIQGQPDEVAP